MHQSALFPGLMREDFAQLDPQVQAVHGGASGLWTGRASVQRGSRVLLRLAATIAGLPTSQRDVLTRVAIEAGEGREVWTRCFGDASPMRSTLSAAAGLLREQLGPVTMQFRIVAAQGSMNWELQRIAFFGLPLPRNCFRVQARAGSTSRGYHFFVAVQVPGIGELIRYEGDLDVPG
jgi:hypothetical protein